MTWTPKAGPTRKPKQSFLRWLVLCPTNRCQTFVTEVSPTHVWQACSLCGRERGRRRREDVLHRPPVGGPSERVAPRFIHGTEVVEHEPCSRAPGPANWASQFPTMEHIRLVAALDPDYHSNIANALRELSTPAPEEPYAYDPDDYPEGYAEGGGGDPSSEPAD